jgi:hypothetical protein
MCHPSRRPRPGRGGLHYRAADEAVDPIVSGFSEGGLQPRSRRPHTSPHRVTTLLEDEIVRLRKTLTDQGLDAGAATIAALRHRPAMRGGTHHIGIGRLHAGTRVILLVCDLQIRVLSHDGQLLRGLTVDPTRNYQPRGVKPGPQPRDKHPGK